MFCRLIFRRHSSQKWAKKLPRDGRATPFNENCIVFCCVSSLHELMWWEKTSKPDWTKEGEGWSGATWNLFMNQKDGETTFDCMPELSQLDRDYRLQVFMCAFFFFDISTICTCCSTPSCRRLWSRVVLCILCFVDIRSHTPQHSALSSKRISSRGDGREEMENCKHSRNYLQPDYVQHEEAHRCTTDECEFVFCGREHAE